MIKEQKSKGVTARSNHPQINPMHVTDMTKAKLEEELKSIEQNKLTSEKRYKQ